MSQMFPNFNVGKSLETAHTALFSLSWTLLALCLQVEVQDLLEIMGAFFFIISFSSFVLYESRGPESWVGFCFLIDSEEKQEKGCCLIED